jgi:hypothetical protein
MDTCLGGREGWTKVEVVVKAFGGLEHLLVVVKIHRHFGDAFFFFFVEEKQKGN